MASLFVQPIAKESSVALFLFLFYVRPIVLDPPFDVLKEFEFPTRLNEYSEERRNGVTIIVGLIDGFTLICGSGAAARFCCIWLGPWRFVV
jgi:hypothetical protein